MNAFRHVPDKADLKMSHKGHKTLDTKKAKAFKWVENV